MHAMNKKLHLRRTAKVWTKSLLKLLVIVGFLGSVNELAFGSHGSQVLFAVWNVGQGSWNTAIKMDRCIHFDVGGEMAPWDQIHKYCNNKIQRVFLSHTDKDHIRFLFDLEKRFPKKVCLLGYPILPQPPKNLSSHQFKSWQWHDRWLKRARQEFKECVPNSEDEFKILYNPIHLLSENSNDLSRVAQWRTFLIPGDSTLKAEAHWISAITSKISTLVLGHHGSKTSTSVALLKSLPQLKMAISSARKQAYGHPHPAIIARLRNKGLSILRTEVWGHLIFAL